MKVTDNKHVHNSKALHELINGDIESNKKITIGKLFAYGSYDSNTIFRYLSDRVLSYVKERQDSTRVMEKGNILNLSVLAQVNDLQKWKENSKIWTKIDCRNCFLVYKANIWRVCLFG